MYSADRTDGSRAFGGRSIPVDAASAKARDLLPSKDLLQGRTYNSETIIGNRAPDSGS